MPTPTPDFSRRGDARRSSITGPVAGRVVALTAALALSLTLAVTGTPALADPAQTPAKAPAKVVPATAVSFTLQGAGFGHGHGLSQYGAYGAARRGLSWKQILAFYYAQTKRVQQNPRTSVKVWITADSDSSLQVRPAPGLRLRQASGRRDVLPTGKNYTAWRVTRSGTGFALSYRNASGSWVRRQTSLSKTQTWWFGATGKSVTIVMPGGAQRVYRGGAALVKNGHGGRTVNRVPMDDYLNSVVPAEMPTSWAVNALRAQAVAARSYASRLKASASPSRGYDLCDTTSCQVYHGYSSTRNGRRTVFETARGNAAVRATAHTILTYRGFIAFAQFGSSNGGVTAAGGHPYLITRADPYDGVITPNTWTRKVTGKTIANAWPSAGTVKALLVTDRTGKGRFGGRVTSLQIIGSKKTVSVSGGAFASKLGLRSTLFKV